MSLRCKVKPTEDTSRRRGVTAAAVAASLLLVTPLVSGCASICETLNRWGACYLDIHGDDPSALPSTTDVSAAERADAVARARPVVRAFVVEENLPGLSLAVGMDGELVWAEGFGWADLDARRPVTPRTQFRIGSVAMPMTAAAVGLLHERGRLDLDAPVRDYVPAFPAKAWSVTTRQLMGHVAGIRHPPLDDEVLYMRGHCDSPAEALARFADDPLLFAPGTRYRYSSYGWTLVAAVVEAVAREPFLDFMQREVFDPLTLRETMLDDVRRPPARRASLYFPFAGTARRGVEHSADGDNSCLQGAEGLLSTPSDVARFGLALLEGRVLRPETLDMLRTPLELESGDSTGYGLGWRVESVALGQPAPTPVASHDGTTGGGSTSLLTLPAHGLVVAVTTNVSNVGSVGALARQLARVFVEAGSAI